VGAGESLALTPVRDTFSCETESLVNVAAIRRIKPNLEPILAKLKTE
jgi:hypothetical protein